MEINDIRQTLQNADTGAKIQVIQAICRDRRADFLPDLLSLLASDELGYFVEECLPSFGEMIIPELISLLSTTETPPTARTRAAGILALLGKKEAIPVLLAAIEHPSSNHAYLNRLAQLAPAELATHLETLLRKNIASAIMTNDDRMADYFVQLIATATQLGSQWRNVAELEQILQHGKHWRLRVAAAEALHHVDPPRYDPLIRRVAALAAQDGQMVLMRALYRLTM